MTEEEQWRRFYPTVQPVGFLLRVAKAHRWLRIHSLPESKRYPESAAELKELLRRHREVATEILDRDDRLICIVGRFVDPLDDDSTRLPESPYSDFWPPGWKFRLARSLPDRSERRDPELVFWIATCPPNWTELGPLVVRAAQDETGPLLFMAPSSGEVYAPYDGGADIVVATQERREELRNRWRAWLSRHPDGL